MHVPGKKTWLWLAALAGGAVAAVLYFFAPDQYAFYPHCAFYAVTGLKCPGCGGLRAAHYILHGEFLAAFRSNPLLVLLLPSLGIGLAGYALRRHAGGAMPSLWDHPGWLWVVLGVVIAFAVIRNLPFAQGF